MITVDKLGVKQDLSFSGSDLRSLGEDAVTKFQDGRATAEHIAQACGKLVTGFLTPISDSTSLDRDRKAPLFIDLAKQWGEVFDGILIPLFAKAMSPSYLDLIQKGQFTQWEPIENPGNSESMRLGELSIKLGEDTYKLTVMLKDGNILAPDPSSKMSGTYSLINDTTGDSFELGKADEAIQKQFETKFAEVKKGK